MQNVILNRQRRDDLSFEKLIEALASAQPLPAVGFVATAACAGFLRIRAVGPAGVENPAKLRLEQVYEARLWTAHWEVRWLKDPEADDGRGRAVALAETPLDWTGWSPLPALEDLEPLEDEVFCRQILDGKVRTGDAPLPGWCWLKPSGRRPVAVPCSAPENAGLAYRLREYLGPAPGRAGERHGNRLVVEARILSIEPLEGPES